MGQAAFSNGYVQFDTTENAVKAFEAFHPWTNEQNLREDAHFCIENVNVEDSNAGVSYVVSSAKIANCEWQCEEIRDWFKKQEGCQSVSQDVMTCENSVNWDVNDKE